MAGGKIDILVEPDTRGFEPKLKTGLAGAMSTAGKMGAALGVAFGAGDLAKQVIDVGVSFESQLNNMSAVTQATGAQMDAVAKKARELGSDQSLTATSANDAAAAMTELAKGGFTVEQSMDAAKGTLQLAAAAQIDAASAATIQSQALQSFSLQASDAARVSDLLAGAANASSAEISGISLGLAQSGTVANQFGVSIEDTTTALAMFANAGIQGSDAGTLLKTALLALTDQGKPAQTAIEELGLTVYDAQENFVGLPSLFGQLADAQRRMTPEAFQAASATLFGSDAMRLAGIAAQQGREGFESLREAVTRQGQAAEAAAAQTKGLPGALERLSNTAEEAKLALYDAFKDDLVVGVDAITTSIDRVGPSVAHTAESIVAGMGKAKSAVEPVADAVGVLIDGMGGLNGLLMAGSALAVSQWIGLPQRITSTTTAMKGFSDELKVQRQLASMSGQDISRLGAAFASLEARSPYVARIGASARAASAGMLEMGSSSVATGKMLTGFDAAAWQTHGRLLQVGGVAQGAFAGGMTAAKGAVGGLVNALGGPLAVGLGVATFALSSAITGFQNMQLIVDESANSARRNAAAYKDMFTALASGGSGIESATKSIGELERSIDKMAQADPGIFHRSLLAIEDLYMSADGFGSEYYKAGIQVRQTADDAKAAKKVFDELGLTNEQLAAAATGTEEAYSKLRGELMQQGRGGEYLAGQLDGLREKFLQAQATIESIGPSGAKAAEAIQKIADGAGDATSRADDLRMAMMELAGINLTAEQASANLTKELANVQGKLGDVAGASLTASGNIDVTTLSGVALHETLNDVGRAMQKSVTAGEDAGAVFERSSGRLEQLRQAAGMGAEEWDRLLQQMQMTPDKLAITADVQTDAAKAELAVIGAWAESFEGKPIEKNLVLKSEEARSQLEDFGFKLEQVNAETGEFKVRMDDAESRDKLEWWLHTGMPQLDGNEAAMKAVMDTTELEGSAKHAQQIIDALALEEPSPQAKMIIDDLLKGKDIAMGELAALAAESPTPRADLERTLLEAGIQLSREQLDALALIVAKPTADVNNKPLADGVDASKRKLDELQDKIVKIRIQEWREYYDSGRATSTSGTAVGQHYALGGRALPAYAEGARHVGYRLPVSGPGTEVTDGFLGVDKAGMPLARLDAGEWVINGRSSQVYDRELAAINAGTFPKLPGYALGGVVTGEQLLAFFDGQTVNGQRARRSLEGDTYNWAGSNWGDCSSTQGQGALFTVGEPATDGRYMATMDEREKLSALGFINGIGGEGTYTIGWFNGGPWGGHTSGTVWPHGASPVHVEMGGARGNGQIGGNAAPATHPQYTDHAYIDLLPGDGSPYNAGESGRESFADGISSTSVSGYTSSSGRNVSWGEAQSLYDQAMDYLNRPRFASGGHVGYRLPVSGPGTEVTDGFLGVDKAGMPLARLDAGEWVINGRSSQVYDRELAAINAGTFPKLPGYALGGIAGIPAAIAPGSFNVESLQDAANELVAAARELSNTAHVWSDGAQRQVVGVGAGLGGQWLAQAKIVQDAERGLAQTRDKVASETMDVAKREEELAEAKAELAKVEADGGELSVSAKRKLEDAERDLAKARDSGKAAKIEDAERKLARAREDASAELEKSADKNAKAVKKAMDNVAKKQDELAKAQDATADSAMELAAAERTVAAARFQALADMATGIGEAFESSFTKIGEFFGEMGRLAEIVEQTRQSVSRLQMEAVLGDIQRTKSLQDLQVKQWDVDRARARGVMSIAEAEWNLQLTREQQAQLGLTSVEAMSGAMDRFRVTGIFAVEEVSSSVIENSAEVRAAQWAVEAAKAEAQLAEKIAVHEQTLAQLQLIDATLSHNAAVEMLRLQTDQLTKQAKELYGLTPNQATGASKGFGGIGKIFGGIGKVIGGLVGAAAGFAVGGPLGALAGAGLALSGTKDIVRGGIDVHTNKKEMKEAWSKMGAGEKVAIVGGSLLGGAATVGGAVLGGTEGAVAGAKIGEQIIDTTVGSVQYGIAEQMDKLNRDAQDQQNTLKLQIEAERQKLEAQRLQTEITFASEKDALMANVEYAKLQQLLAKANTPEQAEAIADAARIEASRAEHMMTVADSQLRELNSMNSHLDELVAATRQASASKGTGLPKLDITIEPPKLPPGESFTREQVKAMLTGVTKGLEQRLRDLETKNQPTADTLLTAQLL